MKVRESSQMGLLKAIGELSDVAGNHARSYYEMAPASILVRLTSQLVAGYQTYGFSLDGNFPEVIDGILHEPSADYLGGEFYIGGKIVKDMAADQAKKLSDRGVTVDREAQRIADRTSRLTEKATLAQSIVSAGADNQMGRVRWQLVKLVPNILGDMTIDG